MLLLTILVTSYYFLTVSAQYGYLEEPRTHVIPHGVARLGSKVIIECSSRHRLNDCEIYKNNGLLRYPSSSSTETQYIIKSATVQDEGRYICQCQVYLFYLLQWTIDTSPPVNFVLKRNLEKPQILVTPMERINIGSKVMIECRNSQYELKECWFHNYRDRRLYYSNSNTDSGVRYVIKSATEVDEGLYICECNTVQDESTRRSDYVTVAINPFLEKPQIHVIPQEEARIGSKVTIECSSSNSRYNLTGCLFYKDNTRIWNPVRSSSTSAVQYIIQNVTAQDKGSYTCYCYNAQNQYTETSNPAKLAINQDFSTSKPATDFATSKLITVTIASIEQSTGGSTIPVVIAIVCSFVLLALLGVVGWIYTSRRKSDKVKQEKVAGGQMPDDKSADTLPEDSLYASVNDEKICTANNDPESDNTSITYALLNLAAENNSIRVDIPNQFAEYATVVTNAKSPK